MRAAKDLFSAQAATYAAFRPTYPAQLYEFIYRHVKHTTNAWDCATGNGQVAVQLAENFAKVDATDISQQQLDNAPKRANVSYTVQRAEKTNFPDDNFDLITVGTALHWFDHDLFFKEVMRVAKDGALLVAWAYAPSRVNKEVDEIIDHICYDILKGYWDEERRYVDEQYKTIPFPFQPLEAPLIDIKLDWTLEQVTGYINSWSSVQHYIKRNDTNPMDQILPQLTEAWGEIGTRQISMPLFIRAGLVSK